MPTIIRKKRRSKVHNHPTTDGTQQQQQKKKKKKDTVLASSLSILPPAPPPPPMIQSKERIVQQVTTAIQQLKRGLSNKYRISFGLYNTNDNTNNTNTNTNHTNIQYIVQHIEYCIIQLQLQVQVLQMGLYCYQYYCIPYLIHRILPIHIQSIIQQQQQQQKKVVVQQQQQQLVQYHQTCIQNSIQHIFYWLLHLHDGYILTISGECRHEHDKQRILLLKMQQQQQQQQQHDDDKDVRKKKHTTHTQQQYFPSNFNTSTTTRNATTNTTKRISTTSTKNSNSTRGTSSTSSSTLYSSQNIYTGTSWDELMHETKGLRIRLLHCLYNNHIKCNNSNSNIRNETTTSSLSLLEGIWDDITCDIDSCGYQLEQLIHTIEQQMYTIQTTFAYFIKEQYIVQILQNVLSSSSFSLSLPSSSQNIGTAHVTLNWKDKLEALRIVSSLLSNSNNNNNNNNNTDVFVLERYGNTFQTRMDDGILPLHYTTIQHWWDDSIINSNNNNTTNTTTTTSSKIYGGCMMYHDPPAPMESSSLSSSSTNNTNLIKKRRLMIHADDEDDDDNDDNNNNTNNVNKNKNNSTTNVRSKYTDLKSNNSIHHADVASNGLTVKLISNSCNDIHQSCDTKPIESVNDIKIQYGINVIDREKAYDSIQVEEAITSYEADQIDQDDENNVCTAHDNDDIIATTKINSSGNIEMIDTKDTLMSIDEEIRQAERRVKHAKRTFVRLLSNNNSVSKDQQQQYDDEFDDINITIWNAREVLREVLMSAGDILLWSVERRNEVVNSTIIIYDQNDTTNHNNSPYKVLQKAIHYFRHANDLVIQQRKLHTSMNPESTNTDENTKITNEFFRRNLLLLQTKAQINIGIGYIQLGMHGFINNSSNITKHHRTLYHDPIQKQQFRSAHDELQIAIDLIAIILYHNPTNHTIQNNMVDDDQRITDRDRIEAYQLHIMALRWKSKSLWYLYKKSESFRIIEEIITPDQLSKNSLLSTYWNIAHDLIHDRTHQNDMKNIVDAIIDVYLEAYISWTTMAEQALNTLERTTVSTIRETTTNQSTMEYYQNIFNYAVKSLTNAAKISLVLHQELERSNLSEKYEEILNGHLVLPLDDLQDTISKIQEWWTRRLKIADEIVTSKQMLSSTIERSDIFSNAPIQSLWDDLPTLRFTIQPNTRRSKYNLGGGNGNNSGYGTGRNNKSVNSNRRYHSEQKGNDNIRTKTMHRPDTGQQDQPAPPQPHQSKQGYRRWREEMIYDPNTGEYVPKLVYPSIAPPMPPHIQKIWNMKKTSIL